MAANVAIALSVDYFPDSWARPFIDTHKSIGITVLGLGLLRLLWRLSHPAPALPAAYRRWERLGSQLAHGLLYALMFALPLTGWMHDSAWNDAASHPMKLYGLIPWPRISWITGIDPARKDLLHDLFGDWHTAFAYALYVVFALHVAAAFKHQYIDREDELQRIGLPARKRS
jgi:cytochrome b561